MTAAPENRAVVAALPAPTPVDRHLAARLLEAAALIERSAGIT